VTEVINGMLLSDACLSIHGKYAKLKIQQKDKEFVMLLWNIFKEIGIVGPHLASALLILRKLVKATLLINSLPLRTLFLLPFILSGMSN
jgi:hypothetical protein